jgi:hypothetical protein
MGRLTRLVDVSGNATCPKEAEMSEEERVDTEETDDVEAHKRRALADEPAENKDDDGDDVEGHMRRA